MRTMNRKVKNVYNFYKFPAVFRSKISAYLRFLVQTSDRVHWEPEKSFTKVPRITDKSSGKNGYTFLSLTWKSHVTKMPFGKVETTTRDYGSLFGKIIRS